MAVDRVAPPAYGIGNVTSPGVEPLFNWYPDIYQKICQDVFSKNCSQPYHSLPLEDQQLLRGFFISQHLHAYCPDCSYGMDIDKIKGSIDYFAKLLVSNCHQVDLILNNHGYLASNVAYADAWRVTLANYTAGAGCVSNAIEEMVLFRHIPKWRTSWTTLKRGMKDRTKTKLHAQEKTGSTRRGRRNLTLSEDRRTVKKEYFFGAS